MAQENDIVLIYLEDKPISFARIEEILPDSKPDWYHVKLLMLQVPVQTVTWILRDRYVGGDEFTMNGKRMRFELVTAPEEDDIETKQGKKIDNPEKKEPRDATVISLSDLRKK